jgi:plastocyanin
MKLFYGIVLVLVVFVSACAQKQQDVQPIAQPTPEAPDTPEMVAEDEAMEEGAMEKGDSMEGEAMDDVEAMEKDGDAMEGESMKDKGSTLSAADIRILGKGGFEPSELAINAGESVTWINDDEKSFTMTIFKDGKWYMNSDVMQPGDLFEYEFGEEGTYEYWTLAYGPMDAKIVVE